MMYRIDQYTTIYGERDGYHDRAPVIAHYVTSKGRKLFKTRQEATDYLNSKDRPEHWNFFRQVVEVNT